MSGSVSSRVPCVFCENPPQDTAKIYLKSGPGYQKYLTGPVCPACKKKYVRFNRIWILCTILSGQLFSLLLFLTQSWFTDASMIFGCVLLGLVFTIPVGIMYRIASEIVYIPKAKAWMERWMKPNR
jgi:hypothetical protein